MLLTADQCHRAAQSHDPRFDGVFFIGIATTRIYCRPICPARISKSSHRRFFASAAAAERFGYRPCLRCRPELAPGKASVDAVSHLAVAAALRIAAGALNGRSVSALARELGVSERHLRRALEREIGVSPVELAQTHRLLLAKRLLADTALSVTRVAFASGFQSLRRFNTTFRERYRLSPSEVRRTARTSSAHSRSTERAVTPSDPVRELFPLTLAYRAPFAWNEILKSIERSALPGMEVVQGKRYARTVRLGDHSGVIVARNAGSPASTAPLAARTHLEIEISLSLLPVLMALLSRLRRFFDLDAEPAVVDAHLAQGGLGALVETHRGIRVPGAFDAFEAVLTALLEGARPGFIRHHQLAERVVQALGDPIDSGIPGLDRLTPTASRVAAAGAEVLSALGVPPTRARTLVAVARALANGDLTLEPGGEVGAAQRALLDIEGVSERLAARIAMRTLYWPDAFAFDDAALQRAAGVTGRGALRAQAERWRPWRAYAAQHLWLRDADASPA
ncbi:MAG: AlkA N-terminal domain-containing protein, partial [Acidobacteriota bacterium]